MPKRKKNISPTQLTLNYLRKRGFACAVTERFIPHINIRRDIFGGDLQCLMGDVTLNIQAGIGAHHAAKLDKAKSLKEVRQWLSSPTRWFQVWTWTKRATLADGSRARKGGQWVPRVTQLKMEGEEMVESDFELA